MKRTTFIFLLAPLALLLMGQAEPQPEQGAFPAEWADVFDVIDLLLVWALGIASAGSGLRAILSRIASWMPFVREFVDRLDADAIFNIEARRAARRKKAGKAADIEVRRIAPVLLLLLLSVPALAQQGAAAPGWLIAPDTMPAAYPTDERPGLELTFLDHAMQQHRVQHGDTLHFDFTQPDLLSITSDTPVTVPFNPVAFPTWYGQPYLPYLRISPYVGPGSIEQHWNPADSTAYVRSTPFRHPVQGHYFALLLTSPGEGRFLRFYLHTSETVADLDTITVTERIEVEVPVQVPVYTVQSAAPLLDSLQAVQEQLRGTAFQVRRAADAADGNQVLLVALSGDVAAIGGAVGAVGDSLASIHQAIKESPVQGKSRSEVIVAELLALTTEQLAGKYFKSRGVDVQGHNLSTCDFANWAQVPCSLTEATIFAAAKEAAAQLGAQ